MTYSIILWGLGAVYNKVFNSIKYLELTDQIRIVGITAKDLPEVNRIDEYDVIDIKELSTAAYDYVFILSDNYYNEMVNIGVNDYHIDRKKLVHYKALLIPNINIHKYFELLQSRLTIISNNCWGGVVYNSLGLECLTPLKNLFILNDDYLKLLSNVEYYFSLKPQYSRMEIDRHSKKEYPVLRLGDIDIHCNHAEDSESAIDTWMRRVKKVNYNNFFYEMYTESKEISYRFGKITGNTKKICFVPWVAKYKYEMQLELENGQKEFYEAVNSNASLGAHSVKYDLVELLQGNMVFRSV